MSDLLLQVMFLASAMSMVVFSLLQVIKTAINLPKNLVPLIGLVLGMGVGALYIFSDLALAPRLWAGAFAGLSSTGLFELLKHNPGTTDYKKED